MKILRRSPMNEDISLILQSELQSFLNGTGRGINADVKSELRAQFIAMLNDYIAIGYSLIGLWEYDTSTETFNYTGLSHIFNNKLIKYYPYLALHESEFSSIKSKETTKKEYSDSVSKTEDNNRSKTITKNDTFTTDTNGANRSAHEESPITTASINSSPTQSSEWNLSNPTSKDGEQFDHKSTSTDIRTDTHTEEEDLYETHNGSGLSTETIENPDTMMKVFKMDAEEFNVTRFTRLLLDSIIEEKNVIY